MSAPLKHGLSKTGIYAIWSNMIRRCENPNHPYYADYGGRGIVVCERWRNDAGAFASDMGERPVGLTLDRINNDGNYEPGNCRWATRKEQRANSRPITRIRGIKGTKYSHLGESLTLHAWSQRLGIPLPTLAKRLKKGWPAEMLFATARFSSNQWRPEHRERSAGH